MKAATRPARCIPAARLERLRATATAKKEAAAADAQAREDARQQLLAPLPEFEAAPRLTLLPGGLHWSGRAQVPPVGAIVMVSREGHPESVLVQAYCHAAGFLGLVVEAQQPVKRALPKSGPRARCVFAHQLAEAA